MANLFGTGINQVPTNGMLGNLAFQDKAFVSVDKIGIGTTAVDTGTANQSLQNYGGAYISGNTGIGTTNPTTTLDVNGGVRIRGALYDKDNQAGSANQVLISTGSGVDWVNAAPAGAITGLTITEEGSVVGSANSVSLINFVGPNITATASGIGATITVADYVSVSGLATYATTAGIATYATSAGVSTNVIGGIASVTQLNVSGISTLGITTFTGAVSFGTSAFFGDNDILHFGDGNDLRIVHSGNESFIQDIGTGPFYIQSDGTGINLQKVGGENMGVFNTDGSVELYYDNTKEFETTGYGATVFGILQSQGLNITGVSTFSGIATHTTSLFGTQASFTGVVTASSFSGNASSATYASTAGVATALQNARTFEITGDIIASPISFNGTGNVSLAATIQPNSVALGSDTTGDYVQSITGTANQITVTGGTGEGSTPTLSVPNQFTAPQDVTVTRDLQVNRNLNVTGNITIGGTSATLFSQTLNIYDPDIVLGYRTDANGNDISTDNTANHGGVAIASTEGNPLVQLFIAGIETNPATYKKIMWFKAGEFAGLGTDAWLANYAVGIGSTQFPTGTRLAAGSVQITENDLAVVRNINASGIVTASSFSGNASSATYATSAGIATYATNAGVSTSVIGGIGSITQLQVTGVSTFTNGPIFVGTATSTGTASQRLQVTGGAYVSGGLGIGVTNPSGNLHIASNAPTITFTDNNASTNEKNWVQVTNGQELYWQALNDAGSGGGNLFRMTRSAEQINTFEALSSGVSWFEIDNSTQRVGIGTNLASAILDVRGNSWFSPNLTGEKATVLRLGRFVDGVNAAFDIITNDSAGDDLEIQSNRFTGNLRVSRGSPVGVQTTFILASHFQTGTSISIADTTGTTTKIRLDEASDTYFNNSGPVLVGTISSTGTSNQKLQVIGGGYISGNLGIGNTNPGAKLDVTGDIRLSAADPEIEFNSGGPRLKVPSANQLSVHTGGGLNSTSNEVIRINNTGVGIGTNNPTVALQLSPNASISNVGQIPLAGTVGSALTVAQFSYLNNNVNYLRIKATRNAAGVDWTTASTKLVNVIDVTEMGYVEFNPNGSTQGMAFGSGATELVRLTSAGNFGIGTTNPLAKFHVSTGTLPTGLGALPTGTRIISDVNTGSNYFTFRNTSNNQTYAGLLFQDDNIGGYVVQRNAGDSNIDADCMLYGAYNDHVFKTSATINVSGAGTEVLRIKQSGNVGIGTTNPQYKLHVVGSFGATTKSFIIDHPTQEGKKLQYACLEGPENSVYVRGKSQGSTIELPDYWTGLVDEETITVNLTPIGESATPRVNRVINNTVEIFSKDEGELDYYYTVFAERKDVAKLEVEF